MLHHKMFFSVLSFALVASACGDDTSQSADAGVPSSIDANTIDANQQDVPDAGPECGNNVLETDEDCDDGNNAYGDGCSSDCLVEEQCVITHNSGSPLTLSSIKVSTDGTSQVIGTTTLGSDDGTVPSSERRALASCGTHVYAAARSSGAIEHLESQADGSLVAVDTVTQTGVFSVHCLEDADTLIGLSLPPSGSATMSMVSYTVDVDGSLTETGQQPLVFSADANLTFRESVPALVHPTSGELWVVGYYNTGLPGTGDSRAFRVGIDGNGAASVIEGPLDIGAADVGSQIDIGNGGTQMVMAGLSGGCTGAWSLPDTGSLTERDFTTCSGNFGSGRTVAARVADQVFYQGHSGSSVRIHDVVDDALTFEGEAATSSGVRELQLLYDDSVLFTLGSADGGITVFTASLDGKVLTEVPSTLTIPVTGVTTMTTVSCR